MTLLTSIDVIKAYLNRYGEGKLLSLKRLASGCYSVGLECTKMPVQLQKSCQKQHLPLAPSKFKELENEVLCLS